MLTGQQFTKNSFKGEDIFVGIDTHKKSWRIGIFHNETALKTFTQDPKPELLVNYLRKNFPDADYHCAYEAGFCGFWIQKSLVKRGIKCIVVNPADVPTSNKEKEFKNDPRDCMKIARSLRSRLLEPIYIPTDDGLEARQVLRTYSDFSKNYTRYKNKIKALINFYGIQYPLEFKNGNSHWSTAFFTWLKGISLKSSAGNWSFQFYVQECLKAKSLKQQATKEVHVLSKTARFSGQVELLRSIPGIGLITAMIILTEIEDIQRFRNLNQLCAYIGLIPSTKSSGEKERIGDITNRGNKTLKGAIVESAWMAIRSDNDLLYKYLQLTKRMEKNKAIIRIARKLVAAILCVLVNQRKYE